MTAPAADTRPTEPTVRATRYTVSLLPEGDMNAHLYEITVEERGRGLWAILRHRHCLSSSGEWHWESVPSEREDEWLATHRFPLERAKELAKAVAPLITVNGRTVYDALNRSKEPS